MLKVFATQVVISKGYDNTPAIKIMRNNDSLVARFRIGKKVYDSKAENNARWINFSVKAFGSIVERIEKMQLKEGSFVNLMGRLDEDVWEDQTTHEKKSATVIVLEEIEYASGGNKSKDSQVSEQRSGNYNSTPSTPAPASSNGGGFTGYEAFGGSGSFFDEQ